VCESGAHGLDEENWVINDPLTKDHGSKLADESMVRNPTGKKSNFFDEWGMEVPVQKMKVEFNQRERRMKCWARLLAHMAGFAAMNAGATMQQLKIFRPLDAKWRSVIPVIIIQVVVLGVFGIFGFVRSLAKQQAKAEGRAGKRAKMMSEEVFEAENDISSLSISFLLIQVTRFCLSDILPNHEGIEPEETKHLHSWKQVIFLFGTGLACAIIASLLVVAKAKLMPTHHEHHEGAEVEEEEETLAQRLTIVGLNASSMCFAWALLFGTRWLCFKTRAFGLPSIMGRVCMALILSVFAGLCVFGLDFIDDTLKQTGEDRQAAAGAIQMLVNSLGILIGFSWEHSFDGGVAAVASNSDHPEIVKFIMGFAIAGAMTPMWRRHILTKEINLEKRKIEEEEAEASKKGTAPGFTALVNAPS
jgi:MFS family permease